MKKQMIEGCFYFHLRSSEGGNSTFMKLFCRSHLFFCFFLVFSCLSVSLIHFNPESEIEYIVTKINALFLNVSTENRIKGFIVDLAL